MADPSSPVQNLQAICTAESVEMALDPEKSKPLLTMARSRGSVAMDKTLTSASNLAKLLPTGTVLAFQALSPSFSNTGSCQTPNKYLTVCLIGTCSLICFFSSFTDSFIGCNNGKLYLGVATFKGLYVFNPDDYSVQVLQQHSNTMSKFRLRCVDFVHAFLSLLVFVIFAISDSDVRNCLFPEAGANQTAFLQNLPLGIGMLCTFLFTIFPTTRRGIGYSDVAPQTH